VCAYGQEGALVQSLQAAESMMEKAIMSCDVEVQRLQRLLSLQEEKAQWWKVVKEQMVKDLKEREAECQQLREILDSTGRRYKNHLHTLARKQATQTNLMKELYKHMDSHPRFRQLLKRLDVAARIADLESQPLGMSSDFSALDASCCKAGLAEPVIQSSIRPGTARPLTKNVVRGYGQTSLGRNPHDSKRSFRNPKDRDSLGPRFDEPDVPFMSSLTFASASAMPYVSRSSHVTPSSTETKTVPVRHVAWAPHAPATAMYRSSLSDKRPSPSERLYQQENRKQMNVLEGLLGGGAMTPDGRMEPPPRVLLEEWCVGDQHEDACPYEDDAKFLQSQSISQYEDKLLHLEEVVSFLVFFFRVVALFVSNS
jgi:hypothetical protein